MFLPVGVFWQLSTGLLDTALTLLSPCIRADITPAAYIDHATTAGLVDSEYCV